MAQDNTPNESTSSVSINAMISGMVKDVDDTYNPEGAWSHARNATKVTANGSLNTLSNEPANKHCITTTYTIIGCIHLFEDKWAIYSTDNTTSEIGLFDDSECSYVTLVKDPCTPVCDRPGVLVGNSTNLLSFNTRYLIKGAAKQNFDCTWSTYFADGNNPDRYVTIDVEAKRIITNQFVRCRVTEHGCITDTPTCKIDTEMVRLASLMSSPCMKVDKSKSGGTLLNGSYFVTLAYTINSQVATSYFPISNVQPIFSHQNLGGSINITFTNLDTVHFDEFELVVVRTSNQQVSAKRMGIYSTQTQSITIDNINEALTNVPIEQIPIVNPIPERSEAIYAVGDYLTRVAPTNRFDFNYQPLANRIHVKWTSTEYPADYYVKGGNVTSYMRDEIYAFFIRWIYTTGDRSSSYHIPGRAGTLAEKAASNLNSIDLNTERYFETHNTAGNDPGFGSFNLPDGGRVIAQGDMAYWESLEKYPDNKHDVWDLSSHPTWSVDAGNPSYDLCGQFIRHHKMPEDGTISPQGLNENDACMRINAAATKIRLIGVKVQNIAYPLDNDGQPIPGIIGYEILRGSREGNRTVIAKGIINNMRGYTVAGTGQLGLYQNYPYNFQEEDPSLVPAEQIGGPFHSNDHLGNKALYNGIVSFHSPDTSFKHPFLAMNEMKLYTKDTAAITGGFNTVPGHPKEKLLGNLTYILALTIGIGEALLKVKGRTVQTTTSPWVNNIGYWARVPQVDDINGGSGTLTGFIPGAITGTWQSVGGGGQDGYDEEAPVNDGTKATGSIAKTNMNTARNLANTLGDNTAYLLTSFFGPGAFDTIQGQFTNYTPTPGLSSGDWQYEQEDSISKALGQNPLTTALSVLPMLSYYTSIGADTAIRLITSLVPAEQYALRYTSHGFYNQISKLTGTTRYGTENLQYLDNQRQSFPSAISPTGEFEINNLYRSSTVVVSLDNPLPGLTNLDNSLQVVGGQPYKSPGNTFDTTSTSYYAGLIQRIKTQYGQLDSIQQLPISCPFPITPGDMSTDYIFGGDVYVNRYTEKNTFFYFYDWMDGQPDNTEFNYRQRYMVTYPRFWADFSPMEITDAILNFTNISAIAELDTNKWSFDNAKTDNLADLLIKAIISVIQFRVKPGYFYLFQSGVRDFFVESEVNTALRDWGDVPEERHYDPYTYTSTFDLFNPPIIKSGNFYKYDYSLSISKLYSNYVSWAAIQSRDYNPFVAETCYVNESNRLIYSLPQNLENKKDFWRVWLANNYKDFYSKVSVIKSFNQNGAIILFTNDSPVLWKGVDTLESDIGTKITIGDGGLFSQPPQSVVNVDQSYEYGSCQDRLSVLNTPFGAYFISSSQGKIFRLGNNLDDITYSGLKFWFKEYLPFQLLQDFPNFDIIDNPVAGIGCQAIYDNQIETIYFCKKDYRLRNEFRSIVGGVRQEPQAIVTYNSATGTFTARGLDPTGPRSQVTGIKLGDPLYFQDASWTVSYDPKSEKGGWISFHDWHPTLNVPSRLNFLSIQGNTVWRHNQRRDDFCNYYGIYYPFELEYIASTKLSVNTLRSIEYYMECFKYDPDRLDRFHMLNWNFDQAIVHNSEQVSGLLKLNLAAFNDPWGNLAFPRLTGQPAIDILYNKVEQKYRFNMFWDITDDRGEFSQATRQIWVTEPNGYIRNLNGGNLNYNKAQDQRKKFRHYTNRALLTKNPPAPGETNPINMTIKVIVNKDLLSMR